MTVLLNGAVPNFIIFCQGRNESDSDRKLAGRAEGELVG